MTQCPDIAAGWRPISSKRARKLRSRGEHVEWRPQLGRLAWRPQFWFSCPGCGYMITYEEKERARFYYDCPRCEIYSLGDFT